MMRLWRTNNPRRFFSERERRQITAAMKEAESKTSGEIRVKVMSDCSHHHRHTSKQEAYAQFREEGLHKTRDRTGVLILVLLRPRRIELAADIGINERVELGTWRGVMDDIERAFRAKRFTVGLCEGVKTVGAILASHFPKKPDDTNELSDAPIVG